VEVQVHDPDHVGDVVGEQAVALLALAQLRLRAQARGDVPDDGEDLAVGLERDARQVNLGVEDGAVAAPVAPVKVARVAGLHLPQDLARALAGVAAVGLQRRREVVGRGADDLLACAPEELQGPRVAVRDPLLLDDEDRVRGRGEEGAIVGLALEQLPLDPAALGDLALEVGRLRADEPAQLQDEEQPDPGHEEHPEGEVATPDAVLDPEREPAVPDCPPLLGFEGGERAVEQPGEFRPVLANSHAEHVVAVVRRGGGLDVDEALALDQVLRDGEVADVRVDPAGGDERERRRSVVDGHDPRRRHVAPEPGFHEVGRLDRDGMAREVRDAADEGGVPAREDHLGKGEVGLRERQPRLPLRGRGDGEDEVDVLAAPDLLERLGPRELRDPRLDAEPFAGLAQVVERHPPPATVLAELEGREAGAHLDADDGVCRDPGAVGLGERERRGASGGGNGQCEEDGSGGERPASRAHSHTGTRRGPPEAEGRIHGGIG